jgi:uncharacterized membrane protein YgdD (TMEM256/DUF423 family)
MTQQIIILAGSIFGALGIILGAFGAHILKKKLNENQLSSFETGVKYQMYHAILLIVVGLNFQENLALASIFIIVGIIFFSFSIYGLVLSDAFGKKLKILGPITPIGGLLLLTGWVLILFSQL